MQLQQAIKNVLACPSTTFALIGAPGVGKTSATISALKAAGKEVIRVDCANLPAEDLARLPVLSKDKKSLHFAIPQMWTPRENVAIVLDELFKAADDTVNAFLPLVHGKQLFGEQWAEDTIVVVTANSAEFKVGDKLAPHSLNRIVALNIGDPSPEEARRTMLDLNFDARIIGWAEKVPQALVSYDPTVSDKTASELDYYFGYDNRRPRAPFASMRSLHTASHLLKAGIGDGETLAGAIGEKAAKSLALFCREAKSFVDPAAILNGTADVPDHLFDCRQAALTCVAMIDKHNCQPVLAYLKRLPEEVQYLAYRNVSVKSNLTELLMKPGFAKWVEAVSRSS